MADRVSKTEEHAFKKIEKEIRTDSLKSPLFFYGREQYLIQWAIDSIVKKIINSAVKELDCTKLEADGLTLNALVNICETLPVLSEKRVVIIENFSVLSGNKLKNFTEDDENGLSEYMKKLPESCVLIFTANSADKRRKLYKAVVSSGAAYEFKELDDRSLKSFIQKRLKHSGKKACPSVISELVSLSGYYDKETDYTLFNLENDINKLIAHCEGEEVTLSDIRNAVSGNTETNIFDMIDAISQNKKDEAFLLLHNLLNSGESEYKLLALICSQFETILAAKELKEEGRSYREIQDMLNIHEYRVKKAVLFANRYTSEQLYNALKHAYRVDSNIKNGLLDSHLALEMLIAEI